MTAFSRLGRALLLSSMLVAAPIAAMAADLVIGRSTEPSALDPQFSRTGNNQSMADNIFDTLAGTDADLQLYPALATEWTNVEPLVWELKLREGVTFHDGSAFTADDVIFSLDRTDKIPNSPAPFSDNVSSLASVEKIDEHRIRVTTEYPNPGLMEQIGRVFIVSKAAAENATLEDFNSGKATIGTGPYRFNQWNPAETLTLSRYDGYWGEKPDFENVTFRFIANDAARTAALLSGSVDFIDMVAPSDVTRLESQAGLKVFPRESGRVIYLALSMRGDTAPGVVDAAGKEISPNPLRDARVRKAISLMIDRKMMVDRILNGAGTPTAQIAPPALGGYAADLQPGPADAAAAKALLAEAGFPNGFGITISSSNNRFPGDGDIAQAIGQMLTRGGLKVNGVVTQPYNVYAGAASKGELGAYIFSLGASNPSVEGQLRSLLQTHDPDQGTGAFNRMRYSNAAFDAALMEAAQTFDLAERNEKLAAATRIAMEDQAIVPLYMQTIYWAGRDTLDFTPNLSERTTAAEVRSAE